MSRILKQVVITVILLVATTVNGSSYGDRWPATSSGTDLGYINVMNYGARGDNVTDDKVAIQNALNARGTSCTPDTAGTVYFPSGIYRISGTITIPSCVRALGDWGLTSTIRATATYPTGEACTTGRTNCTPMVDLCGTTSLGNHCMLEKLIIDGIDRATVGVFSDEMQEDSGLIDSKILHINRYALWVAQSSTPVTHPSLFRLQSMTAYLADGVCETGAAAILFASGLNSGSLTFQGVNVGGCLGGIASGVPIGIKLDGGGANDTMSLRDIHSEIDGTAIWIGSNNVNVINLTSNNVVITNPAIHIVDGVQGTTIFNIRANSTVLVHDLNNAKDALWSGYGFYLQGVGGDLSESTVLTSESKAGCTTHPCNVIQMLYVPTGLRVPSAVDSTQTCATTFKGMVYFDTDAGLLNAGLLCVCTDNGTSFRWRSVGTPSVDEVGASVTNCGT